MIDLGIVKLDWTVNAGQLLVTGTLAAVGYGLRRIYRATVRFVDKVHHNEDRLDVHGTRLDAAEQMVDRHSKALVNRGDLGLHVKRLYRRRHDDAVEITATDDEEESLT